MLVDAALILDIALFGFTAAQYQNIISMAQLFFCTFQFIVYKHLTEAY